MNPTILKQGVLAHHLCYYKNEMNQYDYYVHADDIENSNEEDDVVDETTTTTIQQNIEKDTTEEYLVNQLFTNAKLEVTQYIDQLKTPIRELFTTTFNDMYNYIFESVEDIYMDSEIDSDDNNDNNDNNNNTNNNNSNEELIIPFYVSQHTAKCQIIVPAEMMNNDNQNV